LLQINYQAEFSVRHGITQHPSKAIEGQNKTKQNKTKQNKKKREKKAITKTYERISLDVLIKF